MISTRRPAASRTSRFLVNMMMIISVSIFLLMQAAVTAQGQESVPRRGLYSTGTYDLSGLESINTTNGNLLLNIPLASLPPGRGGNPGFILRLHYNSKLYNAFIEPEVQPNGDIYNLRMLEPNQDEDEGGWRYNVRYDLNEETLAPNCNSTAGRDIWKLRITFPDGSAHEFRPLGYNDSSHNGFFPIRHDGGQPCGAPAVAGPRTYYSADGSYLRLVFPNDGVNPWTLYFPDGGRVVGGINLQGGPQRSYDRNGNFVDVLYVILANGHNADKIVDSLGRSITVEHDVATRQDYITTAGFGEELKWTVKWGATYVNKTYDALFGCSHSTPKLLRFGHSVVEQITLPLQANALTFKFEYNGKTTPLAPPPDPIESPGWGELSAMTLPSGAKTKYHYFHDDGEQPPAVGAPCWRQVLKNYPVRKELVYRDENDRGYNSSAPPSSAPCDPATESCVTETWNYNMGQTFATTRTLTTITDPAGRFTKEFYFDSDGGSDYYPTNSWSSGLVYRIENPDGTVIERDWQPNTPSGNGSAQMNPYVKFEYTSVPNSSQTTLAKTAGKEFSYDKNGNVTQVKEYDWVNYGNNPMVSGSLLRQTVNEYYNPTPDATNVNFTPNSYHAATWLYVWRAIYSSEGRSGSGQALARTEYSYDNPTLKANLTGQASWDSSKSGYSNPLCTNASLCTVNVVSVSHQYDDYGNRTLSIDARGYQTKLIYGSVGGFTDLYPTTIISAFGIGIQRSTSLQYDFNTGLVTRTTDTDNNVSNETDYNALGRAVEIRAAANVAEEKTTTRLEYSDVSRYVVTRSDLNTAYDGKLVSIQHFDQLGRTRLARQLENAATQNAADETAGIKVQTRYLFSGSNSYQLVSNPYRAALSSTAGSEASMGWTRSKNDSGGRLVEVQTFGGAALPAPWGSNSTSTGTATTAYNAEFTTVADQASRVRRSMIDGLGRLTRVDEPDATSGNLDDVNGNPVQSTSYSYDALDNLRQVTQGSQPRTFVYDSLKRLTSATNPESGTICYGTVISGQCQANGYDANGNLIYKTDARLVRATYAYDALNRNTSVVYTNDPTASTPTITRTYDGATNGKGLIWKTETGGNKGSRTTINGYDRAGRPTSQSQQFFNGGTWSVAYPMAATYDRAGHVLTQTYPSGHTVNYAYDSAGRNSSFTGNLGEGVLRTYANEFQYTASGGLQQERFGTDTPLYHKQRFNQRGQLWDMRLSTVSFASDPANGDRGAIVNYYSDNFVQGGSNAYNNGNLLRQEIYIPGSNFFQQNYSYDSLNRLKSVAEKLNGNGANTLRQAYAYDDRWGNRTIKTNPGESYGGVNNLGFEVQTTTNRLYAPGDLALAEAARRMQYDQAGNLKRDTYTGAGDRTYDAENRMTTALGGNNQWQEYTYNADGQRVRRKVDNVETWQVYGMDGELLAEYAANASNSTPQKEYGYRNGQLLITADAPTSTPVNLALNKTATQSSDPGWGGPASKAVDGNADGNFYNWSVAHTNNDAQAWWQVDLGSIQAVQSVEVWNRTDCCADRLTNFNVILLDATQSTVATVNVPGQAGTPATVSISGTARYVKVQLIGTNYLALAEVKVWGTPVTNLALNKTATQSSDPGWGGPPGKAVDGNTDGNFFNWSVMHTSNDAQGWWQVDLGSMQAVQGVEVWNRTECCADRLTNFNVILLDANQSAVSTVNVPGQGGMPTMVSISGMARYVKVQLVGTNYLAMAEVRVLGASTGSSNINWLVTDQLGTPRMIFDKTGSLTATKRHDYLPFGEEIFAGTGGRTTAQGYGTADGVRQKFTQKERDTETGLDYFFARYYSPIQGRFTSPDEFTGGPDELFVLGRGDSEQQALPYADITNPQSLNKYQYSFNNPLRYADPDGHDPQDPSPQDPSPGIVQRIIDSTNNIIGTLLRNFEKGRDTVPEEEPHRAPLSMGDKEMQTYIDAKGRAADQAREVMSYGDFTGVATTVHGVQTGNRKETVLGAIGMALNVAPALKPVSAALEKVGLKIITSKAGVMTAEGTASQAGRLFNLLRGGNKVQMVKPGVYTAKSAFGQGSVTFRIAAAAKSRMVSVDFKYIQPPLRKIHLIK